MAKLTALADLHTEWVAEHAEQSGFKPEGRPKKSDYNLHHVDLDADQAALDDFHARAAAALSGDVSRANELKEYWLRGKGAARWATWTQLYDHLREHVSPERAKRIAAEWFHERYGYWPGHQKGSNPTGPG